MAQTYPNFAGHQRVDLPDMLAVAQATPAAITDELGANFMVPTGTYSIVAGFQPTASDPNTVSVGVQGTSNVAWLGRRENGVTKGPTLAACGPQALAISISNYPSGTFGIFIRVDNTPQVPQQRIFWDQSGLDEVAQLTPTLLQAAWEVRIEANPPSTGEWLQIGTAQVTAQGSGSGSTVVVTDSRRLFFEGTVGQQTTTTWGSSTDRSTNRALNPITSLQQKLDALTTCILDVKGRSLVNWYDPYIGGLNIGTRFQPTDVPSLERVAIGDTNFVLQGSSTFTSLWLNGPSTSFALNRYNNQLNLFLGNQLAFSAAAGGYAALGRVSNLIAPVQPLTVWNYAPYGRVAQFANDSQYPASISIGDTGVTGGRVDFAPPSLSDFTSAYWSIRATFASPQTFSILGTSGTILQAQGIGGGYNVSLYGSTLLLQGSAATTIYGYNGITMQGVVTAQNGLTVINRPVYANTLPWLNIHYESASNSTLSSGATGSTINVYSSGYATIDLNTPVPQHSSIFVTVPRVNGNNIVCGYELQNNRSRIYIGTNAGSYFDFDVLILNSLG